MCNTKKCVLSVTKIKVNEKNISLIFDKLAFMNTHLVFTNVSHL